MADRRVRVQWLEADGSSPMGRQAEVVMTWPSDLPLPVKGQTLETMNRTVLEVISVGYYIGNGIPEPILMCEAVAHG